MFNYKISKYNKAKLGEFINNESFAQLNVLPISYQRALSYINNPRVDDDDVLLNIAWQENRIIAYRTILPDVIFKNGNPTKLAWISGTWVAPEFRRQGLATTLFNEIYNDWNGLLIYTNYAPTSKKLYDKTNRFKMYRTHLGRRFYLKSDLSDLLISRFSSLSFLKPILPLIDKLFNTLILPFLTNEKNDSLKDFQIKYKTQLNEEESTRLFANTLTMRSKKELDWILDFPWVLNADDGSMEQANKYIFSSVANPFKQYFCLIYKNENPIGIAMITIKNRQMKVPYLYCDKGFEDNMADLMFIEGWKNHTTYLDVFNEELAHSMNLKSTNFAWSSNQERKYMISNVFTDQFPDQKDVSIPDGEGDVVFV